MIIIFEIIASEIRKIPVTKVSTLPKGLWEDKENQSTINFIKNLSDKNNFWEAPTGGKLSFAWNAPSQPPPQTFLLS